jgi:hypothetical protein
LLDVGKRRVYRSQVWWVGMALGERATSDVGPSLTLQPEGPPAPTDAGRHLEFGLAETQAALCVGRHPPGRRSQGMGLARGASRCDPAP